MKRSLSVAKEAIDDLDLWIEVMNGPTICMFITKPMQGDPSGRFKPPVVIDFKFPSQYRLLILLILVLKRNIQINDNRRFEPT